MIRYGFYLYTEHENNYRSEAEILIQANCNVIKGYEYSNANDDFPPLMDIIHHSIKGDVLTVRSLDHLAISVNQLSRIVDLLKSNRMHLVVIEQKSINTIKYGQERVYSYMLRFCDAFSSFISTNSRKGLRQIKPKRYRGWTCDKVKQVKHIYKMVNLGVKVSEASHQYQVGEPTIKKYLALVETGEILEIENYIQVNQVVKKPIGRQKGLSKVSKLKALQVKKLHKKMRAMDIQRQLNISKGTYYRYLQMDEVLLR